MMSPEDIVPVFEGVFVASSDERRQIMMQSIGAEAAPWGDLFAIWDVDTPGQVLGVPHALVSLRFRSPNRNPIAFSSPASCSSVFNDTVECLTVVPVQSSSEVLAPT